MLRNTTHDLTAEEKAALAAANLLGLAAAQAGTPELHADEATAIGPLFRALRGRGIGQPINALLGLYHNASEAAPLVDPGLARALGATNDKATTHG